MTKPIKDDQPVIETNNLDESIETEKPMIETSPELQSALDAIVAADTDIALHKAAVNRLKIKIIELDTAIAECVAKANERAVMADMSLVEMKALANRKIEAQGEIGVLEEVKALAANELNGLNQHEYWLNERRTEVVKDAWKSLFNQMMQALPLDSLRTMISIGYLCGIGQGQIAGMILPDSYDVSLLEEIATQYGIPL